MLYSYFSYIVYSLLITTSSIQSTQTNTTVLSMPPLQLGLRLQQWHQLLGEHNVTGDLQLSLHESHLGIQLAQSNLHHISISHLDSGISLHALWRTLVHLSGLQVQRPLLGHLTVVRNLIAEHCVYRLGLGQVSIDTVLEGKDNSL